MTQHGIIIPIYKNTLSDTEIISLKQCLTILKNHDIIFVTHRYLNCSYYEKICKENDVDLLYEIFPSIYFESISGYNALMLSKIFYQRFLKYDYILLYQLDAYVFSDQLHFWCNKNYDYIGAPWLCIENSTKKPKIAGVGNGGFSLRKTSTFYYLSTTKVKKTKYFHLFFAYHIRIMNLKKNFFQRLIRFILRRFLNLPYEYLNLKNISSKDDFNEDIIWSKVLLEKGILPPHEDALKFSFENYPDFLFRLNSYKLPFGCHAWEKDNFVFWKDYIKN